MTNIGPSQTRFQRRLINMNIYVGNLSLDVTGEELQQEFRTFGTVTSVIIMNDKYIGSGQTKGYGFVEMESKSDGQTAITRLHGKTLKSRVIDVVEALPLSDKMGIVPLREKINNRFNRKADRKRN
jgi:RNA recognition motif-containing protein